MKRTLPLVIALSTLAFVPSLARAQDEATMAPVVLPQAGAMQWGDAPPVFEPGATMAVLQGDPSAEGEYTVRVRFPAGYEVRPHWHPTIENVTVVSGSLHVAMGEKMDTSAGTTLEVGGFASIPAEAPHYAWTTEPVEIQVHGMGPFQLTYVNPEDAPKAASR